MAGNPDGIRSLATYSRLPAERIRYVSDANEATVRSIHRGVLFLMAFWSGSAVQAFAQLTQVFATLDTRDLELVVADVDGSPELYELPEFNGKVHGHGETAWVLDGKIIATSGMGLNTACFEPNTLALLELP
jgi:hypothetical protein